jgi:4-amino-4-deoxy-L-arabinose transferase-like glycosyltransferase
MSAKPPPPQRIAWLARRHSVCARSPGGLVLVLLCAALYVPGLTTLPPIDRDEPRFAQASRQMLDGDSLDDWVVPRVQDVPRLNKPPLIYWLQAVSAGCFGQIPSDESLTLTTGGIGAYRIPSALSAIAAVLFTWRLGLSMLHPLAAWLAAALLASCWLVVADAHLARADELLLACTTWTQWALWEVWTRARRRRHVPLRWPLLFWLGVGLGTLAKGPVTPAIATMTIATLSLTTRRWRWLGELRIGLGVVVAFLIVAPWCVLVANAVGWESLFDAIIDEVLNRSVAPKEGHFGPPGYHLLLMTILFWPGSLLAVAGLQRAWRCARFRRPAETFLLAWLLPAWIVFELIMTKLPHYPLPLYPALALLTGRMLCAAAGGKVRLPRNWAVTVGVVLWSTIGVITTIAAPLSLVTWSSAGVRGQEVVSLAALLVSTSLVMILAVCAVFRRSLLIAQALGIAAMVAATLLIFRLTLPTAAPLWLPSRAVAAIAAADPSGERPLAAAGYFEDSLVFLTHGRLHRIESEHLDTWRHANPRGLVLIHSRLHGDDMRTIAELEGFDYSAGRWVRALLVESPSPSAP